MRPILTGLLIFIFFYLISNMMVKHFNFGVLPSTVLLTLFGDEEQYIDPLSTASFLEFWHMEIFFIMMLLLTLSAVFIRIAKNSNLKIILINTLMLSSLVSLVSLLASFFVSSVFVYLYSSLFVLWHIVAIYMVLYALWKLHHDTSL